MRFARAIGFNRNEIDNIFNILKDTYERNGLRADKIWNIDESGLTTVQAPTKILAKKGSKQVAKMTRAEKGQTVTIACAMNAAGTYLPPMLIFPRKRKNEVL